MNWVMLRGLGRHSDHWGEFTSLMQKNFDKVLTLNLPGIDGDTEDVPISIRDITDRLREQFLANQNGEKWSILAISLGGMIALDWVHRYPEDFVQIVTINSSSRAHSKFYERMQPEAIKTILKSVFEKNVRKRELQILKLTTNLIEIDSKMLDQAQATAAKMSINKRIFFKQLLAASKFKTPDQLKIPYTVIAAKKDRLASFRCSQALAKHFKASLILHDTAGHDLPKDDPKWLIERLLELNNV